MGGERCSCADVDAVPADEAPAARKGAAEDEIYRLLPWLAAPRISSAATCGSLEVGSGLRAPDAQHTRMAREIHRLLPWVAVATVPGKPR